MLQVELFYFATKKIGTGRGAVAATTAVGGTVLLCRHDGAASILDFRPRLANRCSRGAILGRNRAVILDFRPRLANRCSQEAKTRAILASILDFKPRLANRCSQEAKTRANRASILDFKPRLANRCSQEAKTRQSLHPKGWSIVPRPTNAGWAGTSDGVAARGFVNGRGLPRSGGRESTGGAHRSEVPARRQSRPRERLPARRQTRTREHGPLPAGRVGRGIQSLPEGRLGRGNASLPAGRVGRGNTALARRQSRPQSRNN